MQAAEAKARKPRHYVGGFLDMKIKQGICWGIICRNGMSAQEAIDAAKKIGFVAFDFAPEDEWQRIKDNGMELSLVSGHQSLRDGMNKPENFDRIHDELMANIEKAAKFGIHNLCCLSGDRYFNLSEIQGCENCAAVLKSVAAFAEEKGVMLTTELLNSKVDHPGYQCDNTEWGVHLCKLVNSPRVKLLYDIYHMQIMEGDVIRTITKHKDVIGHYHTGGNPGRHEIDESQELNYPAIMKAILANGYTGFVGQEFIPQREAFASLAQGFRICDV
jgi:hydroxypyruvate isomerase